MGAVTAKERSSTNVAKLLRSKPDAKVIDLIAVLQESLSSRGRAKPHLRGTQKSDAVVALKQSLAKIGLGIEEPITSARTADVVSVLQESLTKTVDLVAVLQARLASIHASKKNRIEADGVLRVHDGVTVVFEAKRLKPQQRLHIDLIFDGDTLRLPLPGETWSTEADSGSGFPTERQTHKLPTDSTRAGRHLVETAKTAEGGAWTAPDLTDEFGLSASTLHRRRKEHRIVSWRDAQHQFHYPKWQFTETGALLPGVKEILGLFRSPDEWRVMRYFLTPWHELGERTPLTLLRAGDRDTVISHARAHAQENSW
jgi:hypothetical protein